LDFHPYQTVFPVYCTYTSSILRRQSPSICCSIDHLVSGLLKVTWWRLIATELSLLLISNSSAHYTKGTLITNFNSTNFLYFQPFHHILVPFSTFPRWYSFAIGQRSNSGYESILVNFQFIISLTYKLFTELSREKTMFSSHPENIMNFTPNSVNFPSKIWFRSPLLPRSQIELSVFAQLLRWFTSLYF